ncbi:MAG TPA: hypothetical protein VGJ32_08715 [Solirubrobacteraceae bacterium]|jgi:hypothetical protein
MRPARRLTAAVLALTLGVAMLAAAPVSADTGAAGALYSGTGGTATAPTGEKPQSKLWFNDGAWWAVMYNATTGSFEIYKRANGSWATTGTVVDSRDGSWQDVVWDGAHLQVVSAGSKATSTSAAVRYSRFGYDATAKRYVLEIAQTSLTSYGVEVAVIARDSTGKLWITYTHNSQVYVAHSTTDQATWAAPSVLPAGAPANVSADDISSIVSFNGRIGVMWSNQAPNGTGVPDTYYWATHVDGQSDGAWQVQSALSGIELADDHINLKALSNDPAGQVFAAVKTSLNRANDPQILLLWLDNGGAWHSTTALRVSDGTPTRAQVAIDKGRRELYLLASEGPCCNGGAIYMKKTSLDAIAFPTGAGTAVIQSSTDLKINNVDTPKQPLDASTGLPVLAGDDQTHRYWHTLIPLDGTDIVAPDTTILAGPAGTTASTSAQFSFSASEPGVKFACSLDGAAFAACTSPIVYSGLSARDHTFRVRATDAAGNVDPTPASRSWTVASTPSLFLDGFESGDFSQWTAVLTGADGAAAVESGTVAAGGFAARLSATATTGSFAYARKALAGAPTSVTVSGTFRIDGEGAAGGNVPLLRLYDPAGIRLLTLYRPNGNTKIYVGHSGITAATSGRLPAATFARLDVAVTTAGAGASTLTVRIDGVQVYTTTTASLGTAGVGILQIGNDTKSQAFVVVADDVEAR